jgi:hypothetical protein
MLIAEFKFPLRERIVSSELKAEEEDVLWNEPSLSLLIIIFNCVRDVSKEKQGDLTILLKELGGIHRQQGDLICLLMKISVIHKHKRIHRQKQGDLISHLLFL